MDLAFYRGKRVLLTGHTGFKGTWLSKILVNAGAHVLGYSRCSEKDPNFFELCGVKTQLTHVKGDVRDYGHLLEVLSAFRPEVVFHLAAQPIVRESYASPRYTFETNTMGTINVLEAVRQVDSVRSVVIVTTDKVYRNNEWAWGYRENDVLDGFDPYSNSKSCAELAVASYRRCFFDALGVPVSTARAGNVLGGGDFAKDRIIPDCVRAMQAREAIVVRNPYSVRPYQHVLEPLFAYLLIAARQWDDPSLAGSYNIGPDDEDCIATGELVSLFCEMWGDGATWVGKGASRSAAEKSEPHDGCAPQDGSEPHEAGLLKLDCSRMRTIFGWRPAWHIDACMERVVGLSKLLLAGKDVTSEMDRQIRDYARKRG